MLLPHDSAGWTLLRFLAEGMQVSRRFSSLLNNLGTSQARGRWAFIIVLHWFGDGSTSTFIFCPSFALNILTTYSSPQPCYAMNSSEEVTGA